MLVLRLCGNEEDVEKPRHVGKRQTAGEQENPLHRAVDRGAVTVLREVDAVLHDPLMQKRLADIAAEAGDARNA